jgi:uncharacterized protein YnzC (UPF0291/DUF896 family)
MNNKKKAPKVEDSTDTEVEETTGFVRENYIKSFKLPISLWEENLKFLNTQIEQWLSFQQDYINSVTEFYGKFPGWNGNSKNTDSYFKYPLALQKNYIDSVRATLDSFTKQNLELIQKNIEKGSSLFDSYFNLFRV